MLAQPTDLSSALYSLNFKYRRGVEFWGRSSGQMRLTVCLAGHQDCSLLALVVLLGLTVCAGLQDSLCLCLLHKLVIDIVDSVMTINESARCVREHVCEGAYLQMMSSRILLSSLKILPSGIKVDSREISSDV